MLFERWQRVVRSRRSERALWEPAAGRSWTFGELAASIEGPSRADETVVFPQDRSARFLQEVLRAWRDGRVTCPIEAGRDRPALECLPTGCCHVKATSASTGISRWVIFRETQLAADADQIVTAMGLRPEWPNLGVISLAHSYGFSNLVLPLLLHGIPLVLLESPLPEALRQATADLPAATLPAVPALWRTWSEAGALSPQIRLAISAGAPLPLALEQEVFRRFDLKIHNFYGASECGGIAYDASNIPRTDASLVGTAMPAAQVAVAADGCLEVRGAAVGEGYWPEPDARLGRGCFRTSDLAELRGGDLHLRGRAGDMIQVAGRKVSPESIEEVLSGCAGVEACVVFGIPSRDPGRVEDIVAVVSLSGDGSEEAIRSHALSKLPSWQVPRRWWVTSDLRANERGKLSRAEWRRRFQERG